MPIYLYMKTKYGIDRDTIELAQSGNITAINKLLVCAEPMCYAFLRNRLYNQNNIDDLVNEALLKISTGLYAYDHIRPFQHFVFHLTNQVLLDYIRDSKVEMKLDEPDSESLFAAETDEEYLQQESLTILQDRVRAIIKDFKNPEMKEVCVLHLFDQLTNKEIAEKMGLNEGFIKTHLSRGKKTIRQNLGNRKL